MKDKQPFKVNKASSEFNKNIEVFGGNNIVKVT